MTRISSNFVFIIIYMQIASLSACNQVNQNISNQVVNSVTPDEIKVYEGHYIYGKNLSSFVPCKINDKPGSGKGYWLVTNDEFNKMYQAESKKMMDAAIGTLGPDMTMGLYIKIKGRASPPINTMSGEGYGYLNQYQQEITVTEAIQMKYFILPYDLDLCKSK